MSPFGEVAATDAWFTTRKHGYEHCDSGNLWSPFTFFRGSGLPVTRVKRGATMAIATPPTPPQTLPTPAPEQLLPPTPPSPPQIPPTPTRSWWQQRSRFQKLLIVVGAVLLALFVIGRLNQPAAPSAAKTSPSAATASSLSASVAPTVSAVATAPTPTPVPTPKITIGQANARASAAQYLSISAFSRAGLIRQLSSSAGEGYSVADATYGVDSLNTDWNAQAALSAKQYLSISPFSRAGLIQQLSSSAGEGFTYAQAVYGVTAAGL